MNEKMEQLKKRISDSGLTGVETAHIRDDYEPVGQMMINLLTESGEYVQRKTPAYAYVEQKWRIFRKGNEPY
ncbi:MAG: hypothetical protein OCU18_03880 [Candidatus Syntrophoarchaeum sp.]|nr:hypothetical protein [Candidatus Syntrophoarchaeum sp.]